MVSVRNYIAPSPPLTKVTSQWEGLLYGVLAELVKCDSLLNCNGLKAVRKFESFTHRHKFLSGLVVRKWKRDRL